MFPSWPIEQLGPNLGALSEWKQKRCEWRRRLGGEGGVKAYLGTDRPNYMHKSNTMLYDCGGEVSDCDWDGEMAGQEMGTVKIVATGWPGSSHQTIIILH